MRTGASVFYRRLARPLVDQKRIADHVIVTPFLRIAHGNYSRSSLKNWTRILFLFLVITGSSFRGVP